MGLVTDLIPLNYREEKKRFLADPTFNPQFHYSRDFSPEELLKHGTPSESYQALAQKIIDATFTKFTPQQLQQQRGQLLTQEEVTRVMTNFLIRHKLEKKFPIIWSDKVVSRASVDTDNTIVFRLPCRIFKEDLDGLVYHEIGTHAIRRINYEQQPWYRQKKRFGFKPYLKTEEGLAVLHSLLPKNEIFAYRQAIYHLATSVAQEGSFLDVWQFLMQYYPDDPEAAFTLATKKKRGLTDTSQPGGFTKDYIYFEGFVEIVKFMLEQNFPLKGLYFGKLAWEDIHKAIELNPDFEPLLPSFYTEDPSVYQQRVREIARANFII